MDDFEFMHNMSDRTFNAPDGLGGSYYTNMRGATYKIQDHIATLVDTPDEVLEAEATDAQPYMPMPTEWDNMEPAAPAETKLTEDMLVLDKNFVKAASNVYELFEGQAFEGTADEAVQYGMDTMGEFAFNFFGVPNVQVSGTESGFAGGGTLAQAATIIGTGSPEHAQAFLYMLEQYERLPNWTYAGMGRMFRGLMNDPTTALGIAGAGAPIVLKKLGQKTAAEGVKAALRALARNPVKTGAVAGAGYSMGSEGALMGIESASGKELTPGEIALRTGISGTVGAAAGAGIGKAADVVLPAVGKMIIGAGDAAKARMSGGGTQLNSGLDPDPLIAAAGDAVRELTTEAAPSVSPDVIDLPEGAMMGTLIDDLYGEGAVEPGGNLYDVAKKLNDRSRAGGDRSAPTNENQEIIANMMAKEILHAMQAKGNAADWYKTKITNAMNIAQRIYPELSDPTEASAFKFIMAITSNGADVASNVVNTVDAYGQYRKTGKMPIIGYGREKPSMEFAFNLFNELEEQLGSKEEVFKLLNTRMQVRDLDKLGAEYGFTISGENKGTMMPASVMFGPKIGGAFYQNLEGNFDMLTMDRWFMRMWGRMSGTLIPERSPATLAKQQTRVRSAITPEAAEQYGFVYDDLMNDDTVLADFADVVHRKFAAGGFKDKNELTRSAKALDEGGKKVLETPAGGGHRSYMRSTVDRAVEILRANGLDTDAASAQALLWYPEKELYGKLGVGNKKSAPTDYEAELAKLARERGIDVSDITGQP